MKNVLDKHGWFLTILVVGVLLRVFFMLNQGFMSDELSAWFRLDYSSLSALLEKGVKVGDMHPAFYQILLFYWSKWLGDSEFVLRLPALFFYILSSFLLYKIAITYFTKWAGIVALLLLSTLVFPIIDTTLTRPYTSGIFFSLLFYYGLFQLMHTTKVNYKNISILIFGAIGAMYSHYFAFFTVGCVGILSIFFLDKKKWLYLILSGVIAVVCFLPHWSITAFQLSRGGLQWLSYPDKEWFFKFIFMFLNHSEVILCAVVILPVLAYFGNKYKSKFTKQVNFSILAFLLVLVAGYLVSYLYTPVLREKGLLFVLPLGLLAYGNSFSRFKAHYRFFILSGLLIGCTVNSIWKGKLYEPVHFGALKEIAKITATLNEKYGEKNILHFGNFVNPAYFNYYYYDLVKDKKLERDINFASTSLWSTANFDSVATQVIAKCKTAQQPLASVIHSNMTMHPLIFELLQYYYPTVEESNLFFNSGLLLFSKKETQRVFVDSITPTTHKSVYENWNNSPSNQTYLGELKISVGEVRKLVDQKSSYLLIKGWGEKAEGSEFRTTVVAERQGKPIKLYNGDFALYQHFDMQMIQSESGKVNYFLPFILTDHLKNDDVVKVFIQNNENKRVSAQKPKIYAVDLEK